MAKARAKRGQVELVFRTHGGKRPGAGRKPVGARAGANHRTRPGHDPWHPVHVTLRVVGSAAGLRRKDMYLAIREATIVSAKREEFRIVQMSIQRDHLHLVVEASSRAALSSGVRGFSISAARQINKAYTERGGDRRTGRVFADRYHARPLTSPRAVRNCLAYVLSNWRKHGEDRTPFARTWNVGKVGAWRQPRLASGGFHAPLSEPGMHLSLCTRLSTMSRVVRWSLSLLRVYSFRCSLWSQASSACDVTYMTFPSGFVAVLIAASLRHVRGFPALGLLRKLRPSSETSPDLVACRASRARRSDRGSRVQRSHPRCCRWAALPLAVLTTRRFGTRRWRIE